MISAHEMRCILQDLKRIRYLKRGEAVKLVDANYRTLNEVANSSAEEICLATDIPVPRAVRIQQQAEAYLQPKGIWRDKLRFPSLDDVIFLDIEYTAIESKIWLISFLHQNNVDQFYLPANTSDLFLLEQIYQYLIRYPGKTLACYSLTNFDFRVLYQVAMKHDFDELIDFLEMTRLVDLGLELNKVYDPPKGSLKLKDLAKVYDYPLRILEMSGAKLSDQYGEELRNYGKLSPEFVKMAFAYNEDDVKIMKHLLEAFGDMVEYY